MSPSRGPTSQPLSSQKRSKTTNRSLRAGRPPLLRSAPSPAIKPTEHGSSTVGSSQPSAKSGKNASSKATKALINAHHNLHKSRTKAVAAGQVDIVSRIDEQLTQLGGLQAYQQASLTGQSADRGGDSSIILVKWLEELVQARYNSTINGTAATETDSTTSLNTGRDATHAARRGMRVLEVGSLSSRNAISRATARRRPHPDLIESVHRIDLKSQEPGIIEEIDFMDLSIPPADESKYDILSLSLVLNYVSNARDRGEMLKWTTNFLRMEGRNRDNDGDNNRKENNVKEEQKENSPPFLPCLFVVLPLPCLSNSRYLDQDRFREMMATLGYSGLKFHQSAKLHYELFHWNGSVDARSSGFKKIEVNPGKKRNNFSIVLDMG